MKVYLLRASEWSTDVEYVCASKEIADKYRRILGESYGLEDDAIEEFISCTEMDLEEE
jgi:hypothetical protein